MVADLNGIVFGQIYGDNSGGAEVDTDGDGTPTQEDEFVSFTNTTGASVDISGWQVWSDWSGSGAPDSGTDGLYHTFPASTVLAAGQTLYVINEITGAPPSWAQEASEGGVESGAGGISTNFLSEGDTGGTESVALVDPVSGDYIIINMSINPSIIPSEPGFPGTTNVGETNVDGVQNDQNAGSSYLYNDGTDQYDYAATFVPCFTPGTLIRTPLGDRRVEELNIGDLVLTVDHGAQPIRSIIMRNLDFTGDVTASQRPIRFAPGALGHGSPTSVLRVSPQHRMLVRLQNGVETLVPAKALINRPGVRVMHGMRKIRYIHLIFERHELIFGNDAPSESFLPGPYSQTMKSRPQPTHNMAITPPARPVMSVQEGKRLHHGPLAPLP